MKELKYTEILKANKALGETVSGHPPYNVKVLSNIITAQFNELFEYVLREQQINATVTSGDYDNIVQDSQRFSSSDAVVIFWELPNLIDGLQYKADVMEEAEIDNLVEKTKSEIDFVFQQLAKTPTVIFNKFTAQAFNYPYLRENAFDNICHTLNAYVAGNLPSNVTLVDIDKLFLKLSIQKCIDLRYYYSSKSLYTIEFYKEYAAYVSPVVSSVLGKAKKAIIFDCDNTLWKGVVGEDGVDGIELSAKDKGGGIFEEVHHLARSLSKQGILIGLCSKNNPEDVDEVFLRREDLTLREDDILIKKVNWNDKVSNLREIAEELNIGVDSLVFVDDSSFEVNYVKENLPEVTTLQVADKLHSYPSMLREQFGLFYKKSVTKEDKARGGLYKVEQSRKKERDRFDSLDQYLRSLGLTLTIFIDDREHIERAAQMTQKTNQFNFTTRRYTAPEIEAFITLPDSRLYVFSVADKFGDHGITGMAIIRMQGELADIDTFLMSCRVIGRNIEVAFLDFVLQDLHAKGINTVRASYLPTMKNHQVESFYDDFGFTMDIRGNNGKEYHLNPGNYPVKNIDYITINEK